MHSKRTHLRGLSQVLPSNPSKSRGRENPLQLSSRERLNYSMDECKKRGFDCRGTYFVSVLKLFQSSCSILILSVSDFHQLTGTSICLEKFGPSGILHQVFPCVCHVFLRQKSPWGRCKWWGFLGGLPWHLRWSQAFMMSYVFRGARNNPDLLLISAVTPRHLHQMDKVLLEPFKSFLHFSLSSLWESSTYLGGIVEKTMQMYI